MRALGLPLAVLLTSPAWAQGPEPGAPNRAAAARAPAFRRGSDYVFTPDTRTKVKRTALSLRGATGATVAPDGVTYFIDAPRKKERGGFLISKKHPRGVFFATSEVHDVIFSPSGEYVAVMDDQTNVATVLSVPDGKLVRKASQAQLMRFRSSHTFQYRTLCQLFEVDLPGDGAPRAVGPKLCGGADASNDGAVWLVTQPSRHGRVLSLRSFSTLTRLDGASGATTDISPGGSFHDPRVSDGGQRICYGKSGSLYCRDLASGRTDSLGAIDAARIHWARQDQLLLGATSRDLVLVDFAERIMRKLWSKDGIRYWRFLPGARRIYAYDQGASLLDLEAGTSIEIFPKDVYVGGFVPVPGRVDRFMTGREIKSHRDHYWIDLVARPSKR